MKLFFRFKTILFFIVLIVPAVAGAEKTGTIPVPREKPVSCDKGLSFENYRKLHRLFRKWDDGLFGSRNYHEKELRSLLFDSIGKCVTTGFDYVYLYPEREYRKYFYCTFIHGKWLKVAGIIDAESLKEIIKDDPVLVKKWWRSGRYVSLTGKITRFRLEKEDPRRIVLYFDRVTLKEQVKGGGAP